MQEENRPKLIEMWHVSLNENKITPVLVKSYTQHHVIFEQGKIAPIRSKTHEYHASEPMAIDMLLRFNSDMVKMLRAKADFYEESVEKLKALRQAALDKIAADKEKSNEQSSDDASPDDDGTNSDVR